MAKGGDTSTTVNAPWAEAQPYLKDVLGGAQTAYNNSATPAPQTTEAQKQITDIAGQGNPLAGYSTDAVSGILQGNGNPFWTAAIDTQAGKLTDDINRSVAGAGRYGSAFHAGTVADNVGNFREKALADNWNSNVTNQLNAVAAAPGAYGQRFLPAQALSGVGGQIDQQPWTRLNNYAGIAGPIANAGSTATGTTSGRPNYAAPFGGILGGAQIGTNPALLAATGGNSAWLGPLLGGAAGLFGI